MNVYSMVSRERLVSVSLPGGGGGLPYMLVGMCHFWGVLLAQKINFTVSFLVKSQRVLILIKRHLLGQNFG